MKRVLLVLLWLSPALAAISQQTQSVSGVIIDETGVPVQGATIITSETKRATTSNDVGAFNLNKVLDKESITVTAVGFLSKTVSVANSPILRIELIRLTQALEDVVVIGYGEARRKDLTGAVGSVNINDLRKAPVGSFDEALAGRVAGVQVFSNDGQPGSNYNIVIRGGNSITQSTAPLYVIDGYPVESPDNGALNPEEIASIEVLKDASATAIYGARAANGVIIITTKKGKAGKTTVSYDTWYGLQKVLKKQEMMLPYDFVKYQLELNPGTAATLYLSDGKTLEDYKHVKGIKWQDELFRTGNAQNHTIAIRGGNDKTTFSLSGNIFDQDGIILNSGSSRYQGRLNLEHKINNNIRVGINTNYSYNKTYGQIAASTTDPLSSGSTGNASSYYVYSAWGYRPISGKNDEFLLESPFDEDVASTVELRVNPVINAQNAYRYTHRNTLYANGFVEYSFLKHFKLNIRGGLNQYNSRTERFNNSKTAAGNPNTTYGATYGVNGSISNTYYRSLLNENTLTYDNVFGKKHKLNAVAGVSIQRTISDANGFVAILVPNELLGIKGLDEGTPFENTSSSSESRLSSFLGRVNYTFDSKYLFTASFRADGSSKFAPKNRWGYFPSGAFAWKFSEENFMKNSKWLSDGKLRVSYGTTGNNRVSDFAYLSILRQNVSANSANTNSGYYFNNVFIQGTVPTDVGNDNLVWEKTAQMDVGLDLGFLDNRISLTTDFYYKKTKDLLLNAELPASMGYASAYKNIGSVSNRGIEFTLNTVNIDRKKFGWTSSFNIAFNTNRVDQLNYDQPSLTTRISNWNANFNNASPYIAIPGRQVALFYGYIFDGLYQIDDFDILADGTYLLKSNIPNNGNDASTIRPGHTKYKDLNGDGIVDANDQTVIGNPLPLHMGGFSNNFRLGQFDLNIFFQWSYGNEILNANRIVFEGAERRANLNMLASYADRWSPENPTSLNHVAGGYGPNVYSSRVIEDGSYLRLKTLSFGYNLPSTVLQRIKISALRAYLSAQNLVTWTQYSGIDPEVSVRHSALTPGFDWSAYPRARTVTLGVSITF